MFHQFEWRKAITFCLAILLGFWGLFQPSALADNRSVEVLFFHSKTCPHCIKEKALLEYIDANNKTVKLTEVEVDEQPEKWEQFLRENNVNTGAVPRTLIGDKSFIGFTEEEGELEYNPVYKAYIGYQNQIVAAIEAELGTAINIPGRAIAEESEAAVFPGIPSWIFLLLPIFYALTYPIFNISERPVATGRLWVGGLMGTAVVGLFLAIVLTPDVAIKEFAQNLPFPLFVFTVALADGFNPCAFTVLIILLSLLTYTKSRRDMAIVGSTFVLTSAVMYFIFIMAMVLVGSIFLERYGQIVLVILGTLITIAGAINIKDFFWFKKSVSLSLSKEQQLEVTQKARRIVNQLQTAQRDRGKFAAAILATVLLAIFVNIIELGCTAILPTVYMATLVNSCQTDALFCYSVWTAFYAAIYILPLLAILFSFIYSFSSYRLKEEQGRFLKLFAGAFMVFFGLIMIAKPELLVLG
ncbi:glutaredoxin domain-containing protein [Lyngbya sp. CCY1209]|uniref:glutaredoxin domain-containing protein n=1 Tax=Lyngbya sp. CCY1209 TaxID=2886103 RepID=UPI002D20A63E|nr:glutaredoxin domain-containing protein [Lyngbya sp. CCY1209]MEB3886460.1 glutaredoxin family protein [Lyngbya sp. CCY1209]